MRAAQYAARNDLEHTVLLQRIWINVLAIHLEQQGPQRGVLIRQVQDDLRSADTASTNVLDQLRGGASEKKPSGFKLGARFKIRRAERRKPPADDAHSQPAQFTLLGSPQT